MLLLLLLMGRSFARRGLLVEELVGLRELLGYDRLLGDVVKN